MNEDFFGNLLILSGLFAPLITVGLVEIIRNKIRTGEFFPIDTSEKK